MKIVNVLMFLILVFCSLKTATSKELNIYSHRQPYLLQPFLDAYKNKTNIKLNVVYSSKGLAQRLASEGKNTPADLVLTVDIGRLYIYKDKDLLAKINSKILNDNIPSHLRSKDGTWFGLSKRSRVIGIAKNEFSKGEVSTYEDLANPKFKGKVCSRPGSHVYNRALMASMIANNGYDKALVWAKGLINNLAKRPQGNDRAQIKSIFSGECKIIIINHYYYGKLTYSENDDHKKWASAVKIIFPNQSKNDRGAHINISGGGVVKHSKRKNEAIKFLEFLVGEEAQKIYANVNYEYPINDKFERPIKLKKLGNFKEDKLYIEDIAKLAPKAQEIIDTVYW